MKININFYTNVGKLIQYVGHTKNDKLDYVVSPKGKRLSPAYGKRVYAQSQKGITLLSEARGHGEEVPKKMRHMLRRPVAPKRRCPCHVGNGYTNINCIDIDWNEFRNDKLYWILELETTSPDPKDKGQEDDRYYVASTNSKMSDLIDKVETQEELLMEGDDVFENRNGEVVGLAIFGEW